MKVYFTNRTFNCCNIATYAIKDENKNEAILSVYKYHIAIIVYRQVEKAIQEGLTLVQAHQRNVAFR